MAIKKRKKAVAVAVGSSGAGKTVRYNKDRKPINGTQKTGKNKKVLTFDADTIPLSFTTEHQDFRRKHIALLQALPEFTYDVYIYARTAILGSGLDSADLHYNDMLPLSLYFNYLVTQYNDQVPWYILLSFNKFKETNAASGLGARQPPPEFNAPDTIQIGGFTLAVSDVVKDIYESFIKDTKSWAKPMPLDLFIMAHMAKTYKEMQNGLIGDISALDSINVIEQWGFMDNHPIASVLQRLYNVNFKSDADPLTELQEASFYLDFAIERIKYIRAKEKQEGE